MQYCCSTSLLNMLHDMFAHAITAIYAGHILHVQHFMQRTEQYVAQYIEQRIIAAILHNESYSIVKTYQLPYCFVSGTNLAIRHVCVGSI